MLAYNLLGSQRGQTVVITRTVSEEPQNMIIESRLRNMIEFTSDGNDISFTKMNSIVNEHEDEETAKIDVDMTVWSPHGPLMWTQDCRLQFLRFTQRDSIMFAAINADNTRHLVEVQLACNKFVLRSSFEMETCSALAADACNKYIWAITTTGQIEVHNAADKEYRCFTVPEVYRPMAVTIMNENGRGAVVLLEHVSKHYAALGNMVLTGTELKMENITILATTNMQLQPGSLVQNKGCMLFTLSDGENQKLMTVATHKNNVFCGCNKVYTHNIIHNEPVQRMVFSDVVIHGNDLKIAIILNRNKFTMWTLNMDTGVLSTAKLHFFPDDMSDLILERVVLMRQMQNKLENMARPTLLSCKVTDSITNRMRQQVEICTSTARAMVDSSRASTDSARDLATIKELMVLRHEHEATKKRLTSDHERVIKELTVKHNSRVLELEQRIADLITARDGRIPAKQHEAVKLQGEKTKAELRALEQGFEKARGAHTLVVERLQTEVMQLQQRVKKVLLERDNARSQIDFLVDENKAACKKTTDDHAFAMQVVQDQLTAEKDENARMELKMKTMQETVIVLNRKLEATATEHDMLAARLAEARTVVPDTELVKQLTLQMEAAQNRSRIQYELLQTEIDSLRRANYTLSQSYQLLLHLTKFPFLPDGTSLDTAMQMMRNLTVFQQDLATARTEAKTLRKKVQELEALKL